MNSNEWLIIHVDSETITQREEELKLQEQELKKEEKRKKETVFKNSGVPERFLSESFETYYPRDNNEKKIKASAYKYAISLNSDSVLLFTGNVGTGKTHLGAAIIRIKGGSYYYSDELVTKYAATANFTSPISREDFLKQIIGIDNLVIDEIGRSTNKTLEKELLRIILCRRYDRKKGSCLISNMPKTELIKYLGKAVTDRLNETCISCEFTGESYRASKRNVTQ